MISRLRRAFGVHSGYTYHRRHRQRALALLARLEAAAGPTDPRAIRQCDEYAADVLGWTGYAPWLYVYTAVAGEFREGWLPDNYYGMVVVPALSGAYRGISALRSISARLLPSAALPDVGHFVNGHFLSSRYEIVTDAEIASLLFADSHKIVFKLDDSAQGKGIYVFERGAFDPRVVRSLGNGTFQRYIVQHPFFSEIMPCAVATLRVTTVLDNEGRFTARACYLRLGRTGETHVASSSSLRVPVDPVTGTLGRIAYLPTWLPLDAHPDTGFVFDGQRIPNFSACIAAVLTLHACIPFSRSVGWDVVVEDNGAVAIMEWNGGHNEIKFTEATQGPCFADLGWQGLWRR